MTLSQQKFLQSTHNKEAGLLILQTYNPSRQVEFANNPSLCVLGDFPTLGSVANTCGYEVVKDWLTIEINDFQNWENVPEEYKLQKDSVKAIADMIFNEFRYFKLTEIMLFLQHLKAGKYERFYNTIKGTTILRSLRMFKDYRDMIISREEQRKRKEEFEEGLKHAISYTEFKKMKLKECI